jgi:hypothetical protein
MTVEKNMMLEKLWRELEVEDAMDEEVDVVVGMEEVAELDVEALQAITEGGDRVEKEVEKDTELEEEMGEEMELEKAMDSQ